MSNTRRSSASGEQASTQGYWNQHEYTAVYLYRLMEKGIFEGLCLSLPEAGIFDDLVILSESCVKAIQIKSTQNPKYVLLDTALKPNLIKSMADAWKQLKAKFKREIHLTYIFPGLFSSDDTKLGNTSSSETRHSAEFARFISRNDLTPEIIQLSIWSDRISKLKENSQLDDKEFFEFIAGLSLKDKSELDEHKIKLFPYDSSSMIKKIQDLLPRLIKDASPGEIWNEEKLIAKLGWQSRLSQRNHHVFPLSSNYQKNIATETLFQQIKNTQSGYIALIGPPGIGKSTLLQHELSSKFELRVVRYLAFHPDNRHGLGRAEAVEFFNDVISGLSSQRIKGSPYRNSDLMKLRQEFQKQMDDASSEFQEMGRKTVIVIDGLDHVPREETPQVSFLQELPPANAVPEGVLIVLGTQKADLPGMVPTISQQLKTGGRIIRIKPLTKRAIADLADQSGLQSFVNRSELYKRSRGHPLSTIYYIEALRKATNKEEAIRILGDNGLGQDIEQIYERVWKKIEQVDKATPALALLARTEVSLSCEQLAKVTSDQTVDLVLENAGFLLNYSKDNRLSIFHNSFRLFVSEETAKRFGVFDSKKDTEFISKLARIAYDSPKDDPQYWLRLRYLYRAGQYHDVINLGDTNYFRQSLMSLRSEKDVFADLRLIFSAIKETKDRAALLRTLLIYKETSYRLDGVSEVDFVELLQQLQKPDQAFHYALIADTTKEGWLKLVSHYWNTNQRDIARQLFEANEPLELFYGEHGFDAHDQMSLAEHWFNIAHRFRSVDKLLDLAGCMEARRPVHRGHIDEDRSWISGKLRFYLAMGMLDDEIYDSGVTQIETCFTKIQSDLKLNNEQSAVLAIHTSQRLITRGDVEKSQKFLNIAKNSGLLEITAEDWKYIAANLALRLGKPEFANEITMSLTVPRFDSLNLPTNPNDLAKYMRYLADKIVALNTLAASLNLEIPEEFIEKDHKITKPLAIAHDTLKRLGELQGNISQRLLGTELAEIRTIVLTLSSVKFDSGEYDPDRYRYFLALPNLVKHILQLSSDINKECFTEIVSLVDTLIDNGNSHFSTSYEFQLAFVTGVFNYDHNSERAIQRVKFVENSKQHFSIPHNEVKFVVSLIRAYCDIGQIELAQETFDKIHDHTFGYFLSPKKEPQYHFWKWIYSKACDECPEIMTDGALTFAQFLLGMDETQGDGTAKRVYQCLIEGASFNPALVSGIVSRLLDSNLGTWAEICESTLTAIIKNDSSLAPLAVIAYARLVLPFLQDESTCLLGTALNHMSVHERAKLIEELVYSIEHLCPQSKRKLIVENVIEHAPEMKEKFIKFHEKMTQLSGEKEHSEETKFHSINEFISYSGDIDYEYEAAAESLIPNATQDDITILLEQQPYIKENTICMVEISSWYLTKNNRIEAEKYLNNAKKALSNCWQTKFRNDEIIAVQKLIAKLYPDNAHTIAFETFMNQLLSNGVDLIFIDADEIMKLIKDETPISRLWTETLSHLKSYREFQLASPVLINKEISNAADLMAYLIVQSFSLNCTEVISHAHQAILNIATNSTGSSIFEKVLNLLHTLPDGNKEAAVLITKLSDQPHLKKIILDEANYQVELPDYISTVLSRKVLTELGEEIHETEAIELPKFYSLHLPGESYAKDFKRPPRLSSGDCYMWNDDPFNWTFALERELNMMSEISGISLNSLRRRCAEFMSKEGGKSIFGPNVEKEVSKKMRCLDLSSFHYIIPMPNAAHRAFRKLVNELFRAQVIDLKYLSNIFNYFESDKLNLVSDLCQKSDNSDGPDWS